MTDFTHTTLEELADTIHDAATAARNALAADTTLSPEEREALAARISRANRIASDVLLLDSAAPQKGRWITYEELDANYELK